jgi:hypothetical protein
LTFVFFIKVQADDAIEALGLPEKDVNFYFLSFYALLAAALGGMLWNVLNRINETYPFMASSPYIGGTGSEPHGIGAIIWPASTIAFVFATLVVLNWKYHFIEFREQLLTYFSFLVGITVGSVTFYDLPIAGSIGFRDYFYTTKMSFIEKEFWLVVVWSALLSVSGFMAMALTKNLIAHKKTASATVVWTFLKQVGICIGVTTLAVTCFLIAFPEQPRFETARGIIAGLILRMALFFGLLFPYLSINHFLSSRYIRVMLIPLLYLRRRRNDPNEEKR